MKRQSYTTFNSFSSCYIAPYAYCDCDRLQTNASYTVDSMSEEEEEEEEEARERERDLVFYAQSTITVISGRRGRGGGRSVIIQ